MLFSQFNVVLLLATYASAAPVITNGLRATEINLQDDRFETPHHPAVVALSPRDGPLEQAAEEIAKSALRQKMEQSARKNAALAAMNQRPKVEDAAKVAAVAKVADESVDKSKVVAAGSAVAAGAAVVAAGAAIKHDGPDVKAPPVVPVPIAKPGGPGVTVPPVVPLPAPISVPSVKVPPVVPIVVKPDVPTKVPVVPTTVPVAPAPTKPKSYKSTPSVRVPPVVPIVVKPDVPAKVPIAPAPTKPKDYKPSSPPYVSATPKKPCDKKGH